MWPPERRLRETPSQTAGPYVHIGTVPRFIGIEGVYAEDLGTAPLDSRVAGERIAITGRVFDGTGAVVRDALIESWQADARGLYPGRGEHRGDADPHFPGWGRHPVDGGSGVYRYDTIKPGRVPFIDGRPMAPHITLWIVARGINIGLHTRLYFGDEEAANAEDPLLARIENRARVATLIASRADEAGLATYTFNIHLQGDHETVFLDI